MDTTPHTISGAEWKQILGNAAFRDAWAIEPDATADQLASFIYGVNSTSSVVAPDTLAISSSSTVTT